MKILVIDDDPDVLEMFERVLSDAGHAVRISSNARDGLAEIEQTVPDVLITDVLMPDFDGIEVIKSLRQHYPDLWIIAVSGGGRYMPAHVSLTMSEAFGADRILRKPIQRAELLAALVPE